MFDFKRRSVKAFSVKAFSIIEACLVLSIIGISISIALPVMKLMIYKKSYKVNEIKYHKIRRAIQFYVLTHGYLPDPASSLNGVGYVPFKELGLSKQDALDAHCKPFLFIANTCLCNKGQKRIFIPITASLRAALSKDMVSFCRLYQWGADGKINAMDDYRVRSKIDVLCDGKSVVNSEDDIYIMLPLKRFDSYKEYKNWLADSVDPGKRDDKFRCYNCVAWILISGEYDIAALRGHGKIQVDYTSKKYYLWFQTRFDLAGQIGCPCTAEPIYADFKEEGKKDGNADRKNDGREYSNADGDDDGKKDRGKDGKSDGDGDGKKDRGKDGKSDGDDDGKKDRGKDGKSDGGVDGTVDLQVGWSC